MKHKFRKLRLFFLFIPTAYFCKKICVVECAFLMSVKPPSAMLLHRFNLLHLFSNLKFTCLGRLWERLLYILSYMFLIQIHVALLHVTQTLALKLFAAFLPHTLFHF